ncbi:MAG: hypothetical protein WKF36_11415 [Candidatus Nitrosocosmicus sp.]
MKGQEGKNKEEEEEEEGKIIKPIQYKKGVVATISQHYKYFQTSFFLVKRTKN